MAPETEDTGLDGRVEAWRVRAERIGERARAIAAFDEDDPAAHEVESTVLADLEEDVDALISEGDAVLDDLSARWADDDDVTSAELDLSGAGTVAVLVRTGVTSDAIGARDSAYWLFAGQAQVAADLLAAAEPPAAALEALGGGEPPRFFADAILDPRVVADSRVVPPELGDALDRLSDAAGGELVRLGVCGATIATPGMLTMSATAASAHHPTSPTPTCVRCLADTGSHRLVHRGRARSPCPTPAQCSDSTCGRARRRTSRRAGCSSMSSSAGHRGGRFQVVAEGLDRPTSVDIVRGTAYVVTLDDEVWAVVLDGHRGHGRH